MNVNSQLLELNRLTCFSLWDLTCVTFLYKWLSLCFTSSMLMVQSVPTGCTRRVFHALRGRHSAPLATPLHQLTRCPSSSAWAFPVAGWLSLCYHTRTMPTGSTWALSTGVLLPMRPSSQPLFECWRTSVTTTLPWWLSLRSGYFPLWVLTTGVVGSYGSLTGAADVSRATGYHSDASTMS
jgi:hypothetical protein